MVDEELLIGHLHSQVRDLQVLVNYLQSRTVLVDEDYSYSHTKLRELIGNLRRLERFSSDRVGSPGLRAVWLN